MQSPVKRFVVLLSTVLLYISIQAQNIPLSQFRDSLLPKLGRGDLYDIQQSTEKFEVERVQDSLRVTKVMRARDTTSCSLSIPQGRLTGHDYGEFGGNLIFGSQDGRSDTIFDRFVQDIFTCYGYIYFTSSIWHMSVHYGQLYLLDTTKSQFSAKLVTSFEYPVRNSYVLHDTMYLVSDGKLFRMQYGKPVFITGVPYSCNSIAVVGRYMYFGLHGAYAQLDLKSRQYRYFVYTGK